MHLIIHLVGLVSIGEVAFRRENEVSSEVWIAEQCFDTTYDVAMKNLK